MNENGTRVIFVVIGLAVLAFLVFFLMGRNPADDVQNGAQQVATTTEQFADRSAVRAEAMADLTALRARQEAGETYESLQDEYAEVRANLASAYENAEGTTREEWTEISAAFDDFEAGARAGTSNFLDILSGLITRLSADVRVETSNE
jgi:hypothetical protein